jgi:hypothetical protein
VRQQLPPRTNEIVWHQLTESSSTCMPAPQLVSQIVRRNRPKWIFRLQKAR